MAQHDRMIRRTKERSDREIWLREKAETMEVDVEMLLPEDSSGQCDLPDESEDFNEGDESTERVGPAPDIWP